MQKTLISVLITLGLVVAVLSGLIVPKAWAEPNEDDAQQVSPSVPPMNPPVIPGPPVMGPPPQPHPTGPAGPNDTNGPARLIGEQTKEQQTPEQQQWQKIESSLRELSRRWLQLEFDPGKVALLVEQVEEQIETELVYLKQIAQTEQAKKTVELIDKLLKLHSDSKTELVEKLKDERRQQRLKQLEERRARLRQRYEGTERRRTTDRRRTRETIRQQVEQIPPSTVEPEQPQD